ncbi:MAG: TetR/AcrR family transcriptional regulator [Rhodobiaceae bacterium]|nr:TetR/AcrR family transcriptional regulator [Rhodobiaceae bacterium]MCC0054965.1 TetR/AcrR family transcriptional regulator [Rhodobiaceae bacterium]
MPESSTTPIQTSLPKTKRGRARREQILRAAEQVFAERGFSDTSISDITRVAGTAQGTLYIYFNSKEDIFRELVAEMGHLTRTVVAEAIGSAKGRLEAEKIGLRTFLEFVAERPALYRIVEEARFVHPPSYEAYFASFADAYRRQLETAAKRGDIKPGDAEIRAWALMGMAKTLGERFVLWKKDREIDEVADCAFDLIGKGLEP